MIFASKCGLSIQKIKFTTYTIPMRSKGHKPKRIKVNPGDTCFIFWLFLCLQKHPKNDLDHFGFSKVIKILRKIWVGL